MVAGDCSFTHLPATPHFAPLHTHLRSHFAATCSATATTPFLLRTSLAASPSHRSPPVSTSRHTFLSLPLHTPSLAPYSYVVGDGDAFSLEDESGRVALATGALRAALPSGMPLATGTTKLLDSTRPQVRQSTRLLNHETTRLR